MMATLSSSSVRVEIVAADGLYFIHLPTRKPGDIIKYAPRPGELIVVYVNPSATKLIGAPLRPLEEPMFVYHFIRMLARFGHLPWIVSVTGCDIEHRVNLLFGQMCLQAHRLWSSALKNTINMLDGPIARGAIDLMRWEPGVTFTVHLHVTPVTSPSVVTPLPASPFDSSTTTPSSLVANVSHSESEDGMSTSYSAWASTLFRIERSTSFESSSSIMSIAPVELDPVPGSPSSSTTVPPLQTCTTHIEQPESSSATRPPGAAVRAAFERVRVPTAAWWNGLRS